MVIRMKIIFMGTPDFASGALEAIVKAGHEVAAVVTQPDKPKGRGKEMQMPPVKICALKYGIPVLQPVKVREPGEVAGCFWGGYFCCGRFWAAFAGRNTMPAQIWVCEHPCVPSSQIPWGCAYPVGNFEWGKGNRDNDYADGQRPGYRRHIDDAGSSHRGKGNRGVLIR